MNLLFLIYIIGEKKTVALFATSTVYNTFSKNKILHLAKYLSKYYPYLGLILKKETIHELQLSSAKHSDPYFC